MILRAAVLDNCGVEEYTNAPTMAVQYGHAAVVDVLLQTGGVNANNIAEDGNPACHEAAKHAFAI